MVRLAELHDPGQPGNYRPPGDSRWQVTIVRDSDGRRFATGGTYQEADPPTGLAFDPVSPPARSWISLVTIDLLERDGRTEMALLRTGLPTAGGLDSVCAR